LYRAILYVTNDNADQLFSQYLPSLGNASYGFSTVSPIDLTYGLRIHCDSLPSASGIKQLEFRSILTGYKIVKP